MIRELIVDLAVYICLQLRCSILQYIFLVIGADFYLNGPFLSGQQGSSWSGCVDAGRKDEIIPLKY
jgi:hypothetical protein